LPQILRQFKEENASRVFSFYCCPSFPNLFQNLPLGVNRKKTDTERDIETDPERDPETSSG
jgi:hypothetical protein